MVLRYLEGREHGGPLIARSTVMAVAFNGITTIVGFGQPARGRPPRIFGLELLLTIGATCALVASLAVLPVLLRVVAGRALAQPAADSLSRSPAA